ncbi:hypothetical protein P4S70_21010, partial [Enterovibrio sp. Hal110]
KGVISVIEQDFFILAERGSDSEVSNILPVELSLSNELIGYIKASNTNSGDSFGSSLSFSADGNTLAVGAISEDGGASGINGDESDNSKLLAGAVYIYRKVNDFWQKQAYIKPVIIDAGDRFGFFSRA